MVPTGRINELPYRLLPAQLAGNRLEYSMPVHLCFAFRLVSSGMPAISLSWPRYGSFTKESPV